MIPLPISNLYDQGSPGIASAPPTAVCAMCGGARRLNEPSINNWHIGCWLEVRGYISTAVTLTKNDVPASYSEPELLNALHAVMWRTCQPGATDPAGTYFDGSRIQATGVHIDIWGTFGLTGAVIARHRGLPKEHWMVCVALGTLEALWARQEASGALIDGDPNNDSGNDFLGTLIGEAVLYLKPYVDAATYARWVGCYIKLGEAFLSKDKVPQIDWWVNGNRESFELGLYWMLWQITQQQRWLDTYEKQWAWLTRPMPNVPKGQGWFQVTPTMGYFSEYGYHEDRVIYAPDGTTRLINYDPNYSLLCANALMRGYVHSRDARVLDKATQIYRLVLTKATWAQWEGTKYGLILDGTNGSRQNNHCSFAAPGMSLVPELATKTQQSLVETFRSLARLGGLGVGELRGVNLDLAMWLMVRNTWPGDPLP